MGRGCNNIGRYRSLIRHAAREREIRSELDERRVLAIPPPPPADLSSSLPPPRPVDGFGAATEEVEEEERIGGPDPDPLSVVAPFRLPTKE